MLAGDLRIDRDDAVAPVLQELHYAIRRSARPVGRADDRNGPRIGEQLGDILVPG
jgi:hypothetical protein